MQGKFSNSRRTCLKLSIKVCVFQTTELRKSKVLSSLFLQGTAACGVMFASISFTRSSFSCGAQYSLQVNKWGEPSLAPLSISLSSWRGTDSRHESNCRFSSTTQVFIQPPPKIAKLTKRKPLHSTWCWKTINWVERARMLRWRNRRTLFLFFFFAQRFLMLMELAILSLNAFTEVFVILFELLMHSLYKLLCLVS